MDVKIYSTATCPYCVMAKKYISSRGMSYADIDVSHDRKGLDDMMKLSGQSGVPVILINDQVVIGFDRDKIDALIGK